MIGRVGILRFLVLAGAVACVEALCRYGVIDRFTMQPPTRIAVDLWTILKTGKYNVAIATTLRNAGIGFTLAVTFGIAAAIVVQRLRLLREGLEPLFATYYAIPVLAFYPLLILVFGLGDAPKIAIAFMLGVIAVIVNTLNGLDRVPRALLKTAKVVGMGPIEKARRVTIPYAAPYVLTGIKFAVAYSLIGIVGSEFVMSTQGMGFEISFAYTNFDNATMYPLIVLVLLVSATINLALGAWEKRLLARRGLG